MRLEQVPGGLRLAGWHAGQLVRAAPVLELRDLPALMAEAAEKALLAPPLLDSEAHAGQGAHRREPRALRRAARRAARGAARR